MNLTLGAAVSLGAKGVARSEEQEIMHLLVDLKLYTLETRDITQFIVRFSVALYLNILQDPH